MESAQLRSWEQFNPERQKAASNPVGLAKFADRFPPERVLTVVGTNYRTYGPVVASWLNRAFSVAGEFGPNYNRSDGLVKQTYAQLPGAPRTFVHKCHGGPDSLVTSREAFEIATRFFFGNLYVRLNFIKAHVKRGKDLFGKSEFYFGVSIKPRKVDFDLFHQSAEAENCYGPFSSEDFSDQKVTFNWADGSKGERLIWEGWLDSTAVTLGTDKPATGGNGACDSNTGPYTLSGVLLNGQVQSTGSYSPILLSRWKRGDSCPGAKALTEADWEQLQRLSTSESRAIKSILDIE